VVRAPRADLVPPSFPAPFRIAVPHGHCAGVVIPDPLPADVLTLLLPEERALAGAMGPHRRATFVAGRLAMRTALAELGMAPGPILVGDRGAPLLPAGAEGSISHKRTLAVALAAAAEPERHLGIDLEEIVARRIDISSRVLTSAESEAIAAAPPEERAAAVLLHLSAKEAIYKALDPFVRRYVSFQEAELVIDRAGTAAVSLRLAGGEGPFAAEVWWREIGAPGRFFLTTAAIRRA
jgi:4'-phosphopantetheinyl transferase EntD